MFSCKLIRVAADVLFAYVQRRFRVAVVLFASGPNSGTLSTERGALDESSHIHDFALGRTSALIVLTELL